jgi:hypothetical protein
MNFWERTWEERGDVLKLAYGDTSPPETVVSFSWRDRIRCPGACALPLPPIEASRDPIRHRRDDWLYLTMGLSQPLDRKQVKAEREAGKSYSSYGFELGFIVPDQCDWPADALYGFVTHITDGVEIKWGDRFAFGFTEQADGSLAGFTGHPEQLGVTPFGSIRAVFFWRYLFPDWDFVTSTGKFMILIATGITEREWQVAKETTTAHLLLLLCRSGVGQRTLVNRKCLFDSPRWQDEWDKIKARDPEDCHRELEAGVGQWHLAKPASDA